MSKDKSKQRLMPQGNEELKSKSPLADQVMGNLFAILQTSGVREHVIKPIQRMDPNRGEDD